jgi:type I restriction enzyme M protein
MPKGTSTPVTVSKGNGKRHGTQQSVNSAIKSICDIMRRSNCAGAMKYVPELTWILFLRILDEREAQEADEAEALGIPFSPTIKKPYRWRDWAAPGCALRQGHQGQRLEIRPRGVAALP